MAKAFRWIFFVLPCLLMAAFIAWQPVYFLFFLFAVLFSIIIFWKTEESLLALVFYLPFQIALNLSGGIDLASSRVFIIILFLAWIIKSLAQKSLKIPYSPVSGLIAVFLGLAALSAVFSISPERAAVRLLFFLNIIPVYFIFAAYFNSILKIKRLIYIFLFSAGAIALIGIIQFLAQFIFGIDAVINFLSRDIAPVFYGESFSAAILENPSWLVNVGGVTYLRAISLFADMHMFAIYLGLIIPLSLSLFLFSSYLMFSMRTKAFILLVNLILFFTLLATFSRSGYLGAFLGISAIFLAGWKSFGKRIKLAIGAFILIIAVAGFSFFGVFASRFLSSFDLSEGSNSERVFNWHQAINIIGDYPVIGVGVGAYSLAIDPLTPVKSAVTAHSTYLGIAAEMGLAALLVWAVLLAATIKNLIVIFFSKNIYSEEARIIALGLLGSFVWFSVQSFFDIAIYSPIVLIILMIYFAISVNLKYQFGK